MFSRSFVVACIVAIAYASPLASNRVTVRETTIDSLLKKPGEPVSLVSDWLKGHGIKEPVSLVSDWLKENGVSEPNSFVSDWLKGHGVKDPNSLVSDWVKGHGIIKEPSSLVSDWVKEHGVSEPNSFVSDWVKGHGNKDPISLVSDWVKEHGGDKPVSFVSDWVKGRGNQEPISLVSDWVKEHGVSEPNSFVSDWVKGHGNKDPISLVSDWVKEHGGDKPVSFVSDWVKGHGNQEPISLVSDWVKEHGVSQPTSFVSDWVKGHGKTDPISLVSDWVKEHGGDEPTSFVSDWVKGHGSKDPVSLVSDWVKEHGVSEPTSFVSDWVKGHGSKDPISLVSDWVKEHGGDEPVSFVSDWVKGHGSQEPISLVSDWVKEHGVSQPTSFVSDWVKGHGSKDPVSLVSDWVKEHGVSEPTSFVSDWVKGHGNKDPISLVSDWVKEHGGDEPVSFVSDWVKGHGSKEPVSLVSDWVKEHGVSEPTSFVSDWVKGRGNKDPISLVSDWVKEHGASEPNSLVSDWVHGGKEPISLVSDWMKGHGINDPNSLVSDWVKGQGSNMVVHESRSSVPRQFVESGPAKEDTMLRLRVNLASTDMAGLEKELYAVSDPSSARYGMHLSKEQVEEYVKPPAESVSLVTEWLSGHGIVGKSASPAGDWIEFSIPVSKANELLDANYRVFTHRETGQEQLGTMSYSIPEKLKGHLMLVHPTITLASPLSNLPGKFVEATGNFTERAVPASCGSQVTPACLQSFYGIPTTKATQKKNFIGVTAFGGQFANTADLQTFLKDFRTDLPASTTFTLSSIDGGKNTQTPILAGDEANLDTQYTIGLASNVPETFYATGNTNNGGNFGDAILDMANFVLGLSAPPQTITTSYGDDEDNYSTALAQQVCNSFMQLGARGTSVIFASGDGGVAGGHGVTCTTFVPVFPATCPFLTSVGATTGVTETAASFSSGGFSDVFTAPSYQTSAISSYLSKLGSTNSGLFNKAGRGFPDVSTQGENFQIVKRGKTGGVSGTSCASPTFASVIALLNDQLIAAGKSPLGFLNPLLYAHGSAFHDVTTGNNPGCGTNGFPAKAGWDPVTGLGTPLFASLKTAAGL